MEAALLDRALQLCRRHDPDPQLLALLVRLRQAATVLVFAPAKRVAGRPHWEVGHPGSTVVFAARCAGIRGLHMLAERKAVAVELLNDTGDTEAVRKLLKRGLRELHQYCPALAEELRAFTIEDGVIHYRKRGDSPCIVTDGGFAAVSSTPAHVVGNIEAQFTEEVTP